MIRRVLSLPFVIAIMVVSIVAKVLEMILGVFGYHE